MGLPILLKRSAAYSSKKENCKILIVRVGPTINNMTDSGVRGRKRAKGSELSVCGVVSGTVFPLDLG